MGSLDRKKDDILNDLHSAEGRYNSSEIIDLETEIEANKIKEKIHYATMKDETEEVNKEQDTTIDELEKNLVNYNDDEANTILSNKQTFPRAQRSSREKRENEIWKINELQRKIDTLNTRVEDKIKNWEKIEDIIKTDAFKKSLYCDFGWYEEGDLDVKNIDIVYDERRKGIVIKTKSKYEESLTIPRDKEREKETKIIENQVFIREIEKIGVKLLDELIDQTKDENGKTNRDKFVTKVKEDGGKIETEEEMKQAIRDEVKKRYGKELKGQEEIYLGNLTKFGWWAMHRTKDIIDGKYINIGIGEPVKIDKKSVVTMQSVEFTKKMCELGDILNKKKKETTFNKMYYDVLDHEFQHQKTEDFMENFMEKNKNDLSKLPENSFEAHLFFSTKNELMSFLWNHYDKDWFIDFDAIEKDITKEWIWTTHSYPWQFTETNDKIMQIFKNRVHEYIAFMKKKFTIEYPENNGKYKPEVGFINKLTEEFIAWSDAPSFKLDRKQRKLIADFGKTRLDKVE